MLSLLFYRGGNASDADPEPTYGPSGGANKKRRVNLKYYQVPLSLLGLM